MLLSVGRELHEIFLVMLDMIMPKMGGWKPSGICVSRLRSWKCWVRFRIQPGKSRVRVGGAGDNALFKNGTFEVSWAGGVADILVSP